MLCGTARCPVLHLARARLHSQFHTKSITAAVGAVRTRKSATVIKKAYDTLPSTLTSCPLPPWDGGLSERSSKSVCKESSSSPAAVDSAEKIRKKARSKAQPEVNGDTLNDADVFEQGRSTRRVALPRPADPSLEERFNSNTRSGEPRNQLAKGILENLSRFPNCILLTRVGQFYESYFDQARDVSRLLSIKLTSRKWSGQQVWMCGFPLAHLDKHLKVLVQQHKLSVALCEEFLRRPDPLDAMNSKASFERRVARVLTPGTLIDEAFLNPYENNYLLALSVPSTEATEEVARVKGKAGLAWIDVSTGEFFTESVSQHTVRDHLARIRPSEVVLHESLKLDVSHPVRVTVEEDGLLVSYTSLRGDAKDSISFAALDGQKISVDATDVVFSAEESSAIALLTHYLQTHLLEHSPKAVSPSREHLNNRMRIDAHTLRALEIRENLRDGGASGCLLSTVKKTRTSGGTRLLTKWLCAPSTSINEITARQSLVALFHSRPSLRADIVEYLDTTEDAVRIVQRFILDRGDTSDLSALQQTIDVWTSVRSRFTLEKAMESTEREDVEGRDWASLDRLLLKLVDLRHLSQRIESSIDNGNSEKTNQPLMSGDVTDGVQLDSQQSEQASGVFSIQDMKWTIKPHFSAELSALHEQLQQLLNEKQCMQDEYQRLYDAPSLSLRTSPGYGVHVHVSKRRDLTRLEKSKLFVPIAESQSTKVFMNKEWIVLGIKISRTITDIYTCEKEAFQTLRAEILAEEQTVRRNARIFDELDVASSFAHTAEEMKFVRPKINDRMSFEVVNGRHPPVENGLVSSGRLFTPNSLTLNESSRLHIITGPNMAGKSTFLRQTALIAILAQTGSYVPADSADIGLVDRVFSRIGARDDLSRDRSTFMIEMLETADILKNATDRSLVIMDEVGRGTTVTDGLAIAFATVWHLYHNNRCRTLFATHYHEIVDLLGCNDQSATSPFFPNLAFFCNSVDETDGHYAYARQLKPGVNRNSYGLAVAQFAGMPPVASELATEILEHLKTKENSDFRESLQGLGLSMSMKYASSTMTSNT